jgi:hypothetical protein
VSDNLYRGVVSEHFVDGDGKLTGVILTEAVRFDRRSFLAGQRRDANCRNRGLSEGSSGRQAVGFRGQNRRS